MKKHFLIGASIIALGITATAIYAQVTGTSVVDKMKAVAHSFTLSSVLNPADTGLTSDPVKGKKTGDILTAGEWNRVLELVSEGGSGAGGSGWVDVPLTDTNPFDKTCEYKFTINTNGDNASIGGTNPVFYAAAVDSFAITYVSHSSVITHILASSKNVFRNNGTPVYTVTKIEKLCGGGGGTTTAGGSVQIVEGGIIKTSPKTISNWDLITLEGSWNSGGGDAAPTGGYIYKLGGQAKLAYVEASGISKDITLTTTAQNVHNLTVKLSGDSVIIDPSSSNTLAYIVWKFSGGSASASSSCPSGFVAVGSYCIEPTMNAVGKTWYEAAVACTDKGAQLCHWSEWSAACQKNKLSDVVFGAAGKYEWIDDYSIGNQGIADPIVYSSCKYLSRQADTTAASNTGYRCCMPQK